MTDSIVEESVRIPGDGLTLEGVLTYPCESDPKAAWLILPPHPHLGGRMDNNVVRHLATRSAEDGMASLRFNYRGVGASEIRFVRERSVFDYWTMIERDRRYDEIVPDVLAAHEYLYSALPNVQLVVVGYSLGAILAGLAQPLAGISSIIAVMPPTPRVALDTFQNCPVEKCFVTGDNDFAFMESAFLEQFDRMPEPKHHIRLPGCDHFLRGHEEELYQAIKTHLCKNAP